MKHLKTALITVLTVALIVIPTFAATDVQIYINPNQAWSDGYDTTDTRSKNYGYCTAACRSVYPLSGSDNFSRIQVRVTDPYGSCIMQKTYEVLKEGGGNQTLELDDDLLSWTSVRFQFRGNSSSEAYAVVDYDGM